MTNDRHIGVSSSVPIPDDDDVGQALKLAVSSLDALYKEVGETPNSRERIVMAAAMVTAILCQSMNGTETDAHDTLSLVFGLISRIPIQVLNEGDSMEVAAARTGQKLA